MEFELPGRRNRDEGLELFAGQLIKLDKQVGFKVSSRGWCYELEGFGLITKDKFSLVENLINECRKKGHLPVDFVAEEESRKFSGIEIPESRTPIQYLRSFLSGTLNSAEYYTPNWWKGEEYYIQMVVEKIDLKTLFTPVCERFHIPIATSKGWSSVLQRAEYARRFNEAENDGLKSVLLYCGDHDADGLRISDFLRKNLWDLEDVYWNDGMDGYDPSELIIHRFGLDYEFIIANKLSWIENLITGSGKDLASPSHPNHFMDYVQEYLKKYGARKCEANALVIRPEAGRELCLESIQKYLGEDAEERFEERRQEIIDTVNEFFKKTKLDETLKAGLDIIDKEEKEKS